MRVSLKFKVVCDFLDFYAGYKGIGKFEFYNIYSLNVYSGNHWTLNLGNNRHPFWSENINQNINQNLTLQTEM